MPRPAIADPLCSMRPGYTICGLVLWAIAILSLLAGRPAPARTRLALASQTPPCAPAASGALQPSVEHLGSPSD